MAPRRDIFELDSEFYQKYEDTAIRLAEAERDLVVFSDGLAALEKKLMVRSDDEFYSKHKKRLSELLQRRDARAAPEYMKMVRAKAEAQARKTLYRAQLEMLRMRFEEWRTRSADRRNSF